MRAERINLFIEAQNKCLDDVIKEMKNGCKETHWIWYIFPQIKGLSLSENGFLYALDSVDDAKSYLENDILRTRLFQLLNIIKELPSNDIFEIMGGDPDDQKFASSMTLFELAAPDSQIIKDMFTKFNMERDQFTIDIINSPISEKETEETDIEDYDGFLTRIFNKLLKKA